MGPFEVRTYRDGDDAGVLALLQAAFGSWPGRRVAAHDSPERFFHWKHLENPHGRSFIVLADTGERLIGMRAYMMWPLMAGGEAVGAVQSVDLATHPDYRGQGVNSKLTERAMALLSETKSFALGLPNDMSRSMSRKVGWHPVGKLPVWVRVRRPLRVLHRARAIRAVGRSLALPSVDAAPAVEWLADGASPAELLADARPNGARLATDAGVDYLRWRYEPLLGDYRVVVEEEGGRLSGLAIFGLRQRGELWEGTVCELLVRPGDHRTAARLMRQIVGAAPVDYLAALPAAGSGQTRLLARAGFVPAPTGARSLGVTLYRPGVAPDPRERNSWSLSFGDLERLELC